MTKFFTHKPRLFGNKRGLGAPVGNLIILMACVILSTTVVIFATNVTSNQVQKESLFIAGQTLDTEKAVISIVNTGPTSIRVSQITIKGDKFTNYTSSPGIENGLAKGNSTVLSLNLTANLVTTNDIGRPITIIVTTTQGAYFTETLVQATESTPTPTPGP